MAWTAADIADLSGKGAIVTGASNGLGLLAAGELARRGAKVVFAVRDVAKGEAAASRVRSAAPKAEIVVSRLDLSDLSSIREFAGRMPEVFPNGLDILMNNAGVMALPRRLSADGYELQFATNHLGHFALTGLLMPSLLLRRSPRVVTVSSSLHTRGRIDFDDLNGSRRYSPYAAYLAVETGEPALHLRVAAPGRGHVAAVLGGASRIFGDRAAGGGAPDDREFRARAVDARRERALRAASGDGGSAAALRGHRARRAAGRVLRA